MKNNTILVTALALITTSLYSQESKNIDSLISRKWSIEFSLGQNYPVKPFHSGSFTNPTSKRLLNKSLNHFGFGTRYMFNSNFGFSVNGIYDKVSGKNSIEKLDFKNEQMSLNLEGVVNTGRILNLETLSKNFNFYLHTGLSVSHYKTSLGEAKYKENNFGVIFGLSPYYKLNSFAALKLDYSLQSNLSQHLTWDGYRINPEDNLHAVIHSYSAGLIFYLGDNKSHADWFIKNERDYKLERIGELDNRLEEIETMLNDVDRDGVADYLDSQNNTPNGVQVDTRGRFLDTNMNGTPDELEKKNYQEYVATEKQSEEVYVSLIKAGLINLFYNINEDMPNKESQKEVYNLIKYLKENKSLTIKLKGYTDDSGDMKFNQILSQKRVDNLRNLLVQNGVAENQILVFSVGVENINYASKKFSRRVSVEIK